MFKFVVDIKTPLGHYTRVMITADDPAHANRMVGEMLREFGEEAIHSGKIYRLRVVVYYIDAD